MAVDEQVRPLALPTQGIIGLMVAPRLPTHHAVGASSHHWSWATRTRRTRRIASAAIAFAGLLDVASAITPPLRDRLHALLLVVPLAASQTAAALVGLSGLALLMLARGVRRGHRRAWQLAVLLLMGTFALHILKGGDFEEGSIALIVAAWLVVRRSAFEALVDDDRVVRIVGRLLVAAAGTFVLAVATVEILHGRRRPRPGLISAIAAVAERAVGISHVVLPDRLDDFLQIVLPALAVGLVAGIGWALFLPVVHRRGHDEASRARAIVNEHGDDTLAYFALRHDKQHFFTGHSVVSYAILGSVCLVSPDPIGPHHERAHAWADFRRFADNNGWGMAVMGASEDWLSIYRQSGMRDLYIGDEAVVDCTTFSVEGGKKKGLRQAVNRIANYGYRLEFFDPAHIDDELQCSLIALMADSRQGAVERGFSMTLGRVFDPDDSGLLLAVAFGPDDAPVAFCQFVPAAGIDGYSLDLMRRSRGEHPNGLLDFVVVGTINHVRDAGMRGLALNFATMRAVLAGEKESTLLQRGERWLLQRLSESMQIESLWRYNAKFDPEWCPRYAAYDSYGLFVPAALAVARAESFWELPVIGRFLVPSATA